MFIEVERTIKRKIRAHHRLVVIIKLASLLLVTTFPNGFVRAASLSQVRDVLSNSAPGAIAAHSFSLRINNSLSVGDTVSVAFPAAFGPILLANVSCFAGATAGSPDASHAECQLTSDVATGTPLSLAISGISNPATAGSQTLSVSTMHGGLVVEHSEVVISIIESVAVSASVPSTLNFEILPVANGVPVNGELTSFASASTSIAFGTLVVSSTTIAAQELHVATNAADGFTVTVEQDQDLLSNTGATIAPFNNGSSSVPQPWAAPLADLNATWTFGHFGFTSDDASASYGASLFSGDKWQGFVGTTSVEVMYHSGPADGLTQDKGVAKVAYRIEISPLQQAGDYTNKLTYIATPVF